MKASRGAWVALAAAALGSAASCSLLLDASGEQCRSDADCAARGGTFANARCVESVCAADASAGDACAFEAGADVILSCLGQNPVPAPPPQIHLKVTLTDFFTGVPVQSVRVVGCPNGVDPGCSAPISIQTPDKSGVVQLTIDTHAGPFTGYLIIDPVSADGGLFDLDAGADASSVYYPSRIYYSSPPRTSDTVDNRELITYGSASVIGQVFGTVPDPALGLVFATTVDCLDNVFGGVTTSLDTTTASTKTFYFLNGLPSATAKETDPSGVAAWVNVPTGARTLSARFACSQAPIGAVTLYVFPGTIAYADVGPANTP